MLIALQADIDDMTSAMTGATRKACIIRFEDQINGVIEQYEKVNRLTEIVRGLDAEASAFANVDSVENIEYDKLTKIQGQRENIDKEIERATASIMSALNKQAMLMVTTAKAENGVMANSAANSKAATNTRNRPPAMHTTDCCKGRTQPR